MLTFGFVNCYLQIVPLPMGVMAYYVNYNDLRPEATSLVVFCNVKFFMKYMKLFATIFLFILASTRFKVVGIFNVYFHSIINICAQILDSNLFRIIVDY